MRISDCGSDVCSADLLYEQRDSLGLDAQGVRLVERYYTGFVRAGANLSEADKAHLKDINGQMAKLGTQFSENLLAEVNASAVVVDDKAELDGLTDEQITSAAAKAKERGLDGKRSEEHTSELQSLMRISYAVFCLNKKKK